MFREIIVSESSTGDYASGQKEDSTNVMKWGRASKKLLNRGIWPMVGELLFAVVEVISFLGQQYWNTRIGYRLYWYRLLLHLQHKCTITRITIVEYNFSHGVAIEYGLFCYPRYMLILFLLQKRCLNKNLSTNCRYDDVIVTNTFIM